MLYNIILMGLALMFFKNALESSRASLFVLSILLLGTSSVCAMEDGSEGCPSHFIPTKGKKEGKGKTNRKEEKKGESYPKERTQVTWEDVQKKVNHKVLTKEELNVFLEHYLHIEEESENKKAPKKDRSHKGSIDLKNPRGISDFVETLLIRHRAFRKKIPPTSTKEELLDSVKSNLSLLDLSALKKIHDHILKLTKDPSETNEKVKRISSRDLPSDGEEEIEEPDFEFYNQIWLLDGYLASYDLEGPEKDGVHYAYYILGLRYFLGLRDYKKATNVFLRACSLRPEDANKQLDAFIKFYFFADHDDVPRRPPADYNKARELYQKGLEALNLREEDYNPVHHEYMWSFSFIGQDFERARKHVEQSLKLTNALNSSNEKKRDMQTNLALTLYHLKLYDEVENYLSSLGELSPEEYRILAHIYARKQDWKKAKEYIMRAPGGFANEEDALILAELVINIKSPEFKSIRRGCLQAIKEVIPSIREEVDSLVRTKNKEELRNLIKKGIVLQRLLESKQIYQNFDEHYKLSWIKASQAPETHGDFLRLVDNLAELIETTYRRLRSFDSKDPVIHCQSILDCYERLKSLSDEAELEFKQASFNMARSDLNSKSGTSEFFEFPITDGTSGNLKKVYTRKEASREKKRNRKGNENTKGEREKEKEVSSEAKSEGREKDELSQNSIRSFGNRETEDIWKSRDVRSYPKKTLDILYALAQARNMSHLRQLTPPGAKLEVLHGDREGQPSLRINGQWRICFEWVSGEGAYNVEITDYHP